jgi:hypothetical protein
MAIIFLFFLALLGIGIYQNYQSSQRIKTANLHFDEVLDTIPYFNTDKDYRNRDGLSMIALDATNKKILLARLKSPKSPMEFEDRSTNFKELLKCELIIDGQTLSSKSISGSGKTRSNRNVKSVVLKLWFNTPSAPTFELPFFTRGTSTIKPEQAQQEAQDWEDYIMKAISVRATV